jgi:hypothetical protein
VYGRHLSVRYDELAPYEVYTASVVDERVCGATVERCYWQVTAAACVENLPQCHSANQKSHNDWQLLNPGLLANTRKPTLQSRSTGVLCLSNFSWCIRCYDWPSWFYSADNSQIPRHFLQQLAHSHLSPSAVWRHHTQLYGTTSFVYLTFSQFGRTAVNIGTTTSSKQMCNCQLQTHVYVFAWSSRIRAS